ncbi:transcriptional regulator, LacI family [Nakamurella panacisegetis]|uniref:Transcriptional regulator, LacI family n=1 Tax=Nakamurella panacisegetis TaxID=1090615 RepID=A0A1H0K7J2_9ACTN|nr:LacI family DNA-binding transcriptional regulator [Nakamurella panacisegetis]SDO51864.1 transcriptional regulator, LacI family [Nakamurella panacisegetis]
MQSSPRARRATMTDVARAAQVSLKTVSRYVNGETNIDPVIGARIAEAIAALRFRRNMAAASIRPGQRSQLVGLIIEDVANPFYSALTRSVELALRAAGLLLLAASSEEDPVRFTRLIEQLIERRVDGLIVVAPSHPEPGWPELAREIPALVILDRFDDTIDADSIVGDDVGGGTAATELLVGSGARRIAFVGEALGLSTINGRYQGYLAALAAAGLTADPALVIDGVRTSDDVCTAVTELLRPGVQVDAFFAANNLASLGVLKAFRRLGISRPIVGYDDFESAALVQPAVTVVSHSVADMGRRSAELLLARIDGDRTPAHHLVLPATTTLRASHRAPIPHRPDPPLTEMTTTP